MLADFLRYDSATQTDHTHSSATHTPLYSTPSSPLSQYYFLDFFVRIENPIFFQMNPQVKRNKIERKAVQKLVFEQKKFTLPELKEALKHNYGKGEANTADAEGITVTEDEMNDKVQALLTQTGLTDKDTLSQQYGFKDEDYYYEVLYAKVYDFVYENAVAVDATETDATEDDASSSDGLVDDYGTTEEE